MQRSSDIIPPSRPSAPASRSQSGVPRRRLTKRHRIIGAAIVFFILILAGLALWYHRSQAPQAFIQGNKLQAVFLTNNQVYFGKLQELRDGSIRLTSVYYLQQAANANGTGQNASPNQSKQPDAQASTPKLVKLGSELHGPEDEIIFNKAQYLFWENLKPDGKVSKAIADAQKK